MSDRNGRRAHRARTPQMSAALRHAFDRLEEDDPNAGMRLRQISVADRDMQPVVERLFDYFGRDHSHEEHPFKVAMNVSQRAGEAGDDPDATPLFEALMELPGGQLGTLFAMIDLALAYAAVEGMALGVAYVQADERGHVERARKRPRR